MESDPFFTLLKLEQDARTLATGFPRAKEPEVVYKGIGFGVSRHLVVVSLKDVCEVITYPRVTPIPKVNAWVHGIASIRGDLLPIVHLSSAVGGPATSVKRKATILAVRYLESLIGLVVDEVFGSKRFVAEERENSRQNKEEWLSPYLDGAFVQNERVWNIFSISSLESSGVLARVLQ